MIQKQEKNEETPTKNYDELDYTFLEIKNK